MKKRKSLLILCLSLVVITGLTGCRTARELGCKGLGFAAREGLGWARVLSSPIDIAGPTYATYRYVYAKSNWGGLAKTVSSPFIPVVTIPAGALMMTADVITGLPEILFTAQCSAISYPWESFHYPVSKKWNDSVLFIYTMSTVVVAGSMPSGIEATTSESGTTAFAPVCVPVDPSEE